MDRDLRKIYYLFSKATLDAFKDKKVPNWLAKHPAFQDKKKIKKVFPSFGLNNFIDEINYENVAKDKSLEQDIIIEKFLNEAHNTVDAVYDIFMEIRIKDDHNDPVFSKILSEYMNFLREVKSGLYHADVVRKDGKTKIVFENDISMAGKTIFRANDSIFQTFVKVNQLTEMFKKKYPNQITGSSIMLPNIDSLATAKEYHKSALPNKKYYVVFSGSGDENAWDVSTMSMRGISSCQSWDNTAFRSCLIGSILSKYVGIIYLTSGSQIEGFGSKMIRRCIVRFGINKEKDNEKVIILDKMYDSYDPAIAKLFIDAMKKRTSLPVLDYMGDDIGADTPVAYDIIIPDEKELKQLAPEELPYKDLPFYTKHNLSDPVKPPPTTDKEKEVAWTSLVDVVSSQVRHSVNEHMSYYGFSEKDYGSIAHKARLMLDAYILQLMDKAIANKLNFRLGTKFIKMKMTKYCRELHNKNIDEIKELLKSHGLNTSQQSYNFDTILLDIVQNTAEAYEQEVLAMFV